MKGGLRGTSQKDGGGVSPSRGLLLVAIHHGTDLFIYIGAVEEFWCVFGHRWGRVGQLLKAMVWHAACGIVWKGTGFITPEVHC